VKDETSKIEQRVKRYWYSDGIGELIGGGVFILLALYFAGQQYFGDQSIVGGLLQAFFAVILIGMIFLGRKMINTLKARLTYPRTGYVEYRTGGRNVVWTRVFSFLVAMGVAIAALFIARRIESIDAMVAVTGVLVAVIFLVKQGWFSGIARFYLFSALALVLGIALSVSGLSSGYNLGLFYGIVGIILAISGALTLKHYLIENPLSVEAGNE
jgi:hypothetical protein